MIHDEKTEKAPCSGWYDSLDAGTFSLDLVVTQP